MIVFASNADGPLYRVSENGGVAMPLTQLDKARGEKSHRWPFFLPGGQTFLYLARGQGRRTVYAAALDSPQRRTQILDVDGLAGYARGHLFFRRGQALLAQKFDPDRFVLAGEPLVVIQDVLNNQIDRQVGFTLAENGTLAYRTREIREQELTLFDRTGAGRRMPSTAGQRPGHFEFSPNDRTIVMDDNRPSSDRSLWLMDVARETATRFTFGPGAAPFRYGRPTALTSTFCATNAFSGKPRTAPVMRSWFVLV